MALYSKFEPSKLTLKVQFACDFAYHFAQRTQTQIDRTLLDGSLPAGQGDSPQTPTRHAMSRVRWPRRLSFELCELDQEFSSAILGDMLHIAARRRRQKIFIDERLHGSRILYFITVMPDGVLDHCVSNFGLLGHLQSSTSGWDGAPKSPLLFGRQGPTRQTYYNAGRRGAPNPANCPSLEEPRGNLFESASSQNADRHAASTLLNRNDGAAGRRSKLKTGDRRGLPNQ
jgi:hypothetical protein